MAGTQAGKQADGWVGGQAGDAKLIVAFRNLLAHLKKLTIYFVKKRSEVKRPVVC